MGVYLTSLGKFGVPDRGDQNMDGSCHDGHQASTHLDEEGLVDNSEVFW